MINAYTDDFLEMSREVGHQLSETGEHDVFTILKWALTINYAWIKLRCNRIYTP